MSNLLESLNPTPYGWSNNTYFCNWTGITCDTGNRVTAIQLSRQSLTGILPSNLNSLSYLAQLDLSHNNLTGPVPSLANLQLLQNINLEFNNFTSVPDGCFYGLFSLQLISMSSNFNLAPWTFPTSLVLIDPQYSSVLDSIYFDFTNMEGNLPDIFHSFPRVRYLILHCNNLTRVLPKSLGQTLIACLSLSNQKVGFSDSIHVLSTMTYLRTVELLNNKFTGSIPDYSRYLNELRLDNNFLTGVVPPFLASLDNLEFLLLNINMLRGPIPNFGSHFKVISLYPINRLCPVSDGLCDQMILLDIAEAFGNPVQLTDSWKWDNPNCQNWSFILCRQQDGKVVVVNMARQGFTGTISPEFANLTDLKALNLSGNNLTGSIPASLVTLSQLETLDLSYNNLSGEVPMFPTRVKLNITGQFAGDIRFVFAASEANLARLAYSL
ncbi:hypothetical protein PIB30_062704 [Stylosanthes scabra]|uniref:Leucine-rich repeat-containing N-terminal plant-type domain-containing protein n=1 Tax=Stylosanthes scabra TaxID=79078 RepID=A0ABU6RME0_9FABA|nr:hypothetical protein [Stylosanthes scabra]